MAVAEEAAPPVHQGEEEDDESSEDEAKDNGKLASVFAKIEQAQQQLAGQTAASAEPPERKRKRGGCKDSRKARKRRRREEKLNAAATRLPKDAGKAVAVETSGEKAACASTTPATTAVKLDGQEPEAQQATQAWNPFKPLGEQDSDAANNDSMDVEMAAATGALPVVRPNANERTVFVTNLHFKTQEEDLRSFFEHCGPVRKMLLSKSKATGRPLGFAHVVFETPSAVEAALQCDEKPLHDRVVRVAPAGKDLRVEFRLPSEWEADIRKLITDKYEGMNISSIKDAWEKQHPGQKMTVEKFGFKNFSMAMKSVSGIRIETHQEKSLTLLAFLEGSEKHAEFLSKKASEGAPLPAAKAEEAPGKKASEDSPPPAAKAEQDPGKKASEDAPLTAAEAEEDPGKKASEDAPPPAAEAEEDLSKKASEEAAPHASEAEEGPEAVGSVPPEVASSSACG